MLLQFSWTHSTAGASRHGKGVWGHGEFQVRNTEGQSGDCWHGLSLRFSNSSPDCYLQQFPQEAIFYSKETPLTITHLRKNNLPFCGGTIKISKMRQKNKQSWIMSDAEP